MNKSPSQTRMIQGSTYDFEQTTQAITQWLKFFFGFLMFTAQVIGIYMMSNWNNYLNQNFKFNFNQTLLNYAYIFTVGIPITVVGGILISVIAYCIHKRISSQRKEKDEEGTTDVFRYSFGVFVIIICGTYIIGIGYGLFLIIKMKEKGSVFVDIHRFIVMYLFIGLNILIGSGLVLCGIWILYIINQKIAMKRGKIKLDEELMNNFEGKRPKEMQNLHILNANVKSSCDSKNINEDMSDNKLEK